MEPVTLPPADTQAAIKNRQDVQKSAKQFEAMFMTEMLNHMYEGVETDGPFGGGHGEEVFRSFMIEEYGRKIAQSGQTKISDSLTREILHLQEQQKNPNELNRSQGK
jgi:flagellar protein FlgJ